MKNYTIVISPNDYDIKRAIDGILSVCEHISNFSDEVDAVCRKIAQCYYMAYKRDGNVLTFTEIPRYHVDVNVVSFESFKHVHDSHV